MVMMTWRQALPGSGMGNCLIFRLVLSQWKCGVAGIWGRGDPALRCAPGPAWWGRGMVSQAGPVAQRKAGSSGRGAQNYSAGVLSTAPVSALVTMLAYLAR